MTTRWQRRGPGVAVGPGSRWRPEGTLLAYLVLVATGTVLYFFVPPFAHNGLLFNVLGLTAAGAMVIGARRYRPRAVGAWYLFAAAQVLFVLGDAYYYTSPKLTHHPVVFPSIGDAFYLAVYPLLIAGVLRLIHARNPGRDRSSVIEALMVGTGVGLLSWVFLMHPYAHRPGLSLASRLVSMAYPLMDVVLLAVAARLAIGVGRREPAFYLLMVGVLCLLFSDAVYGYITLTGTYAPGSPLDMGWLTYYFCWGAAALHPSMRGLSVPSLDRHGRFTGTRRLLLTGAALMAPGVQILQAARHQAIDLPVVLAGSIFLFLLAMARMSETNRQHEIAEARERALREAGAALVSATTADATYAAAMGALRTIAGPAAAVRITRVGPEGRAEVVAPATPRLPQVAPEMPLPEWVWARLRLNGIGVLSSGPELSQALALPAGHRSVALAPLFVHDSLNGFLAVSTPREANHQTLDGIGALASQTSLALDAIQRTEELYRERTEARFRSLVQNASDVVTVVDGDLRISFLSPSAERVFGYEPAALLGTGMVELVHPDDRLKLAGALRQASEAGATRPEAVEARWRRRDGSWAHTESLLADLTDDRNVGGVVLNTRDVSERKEVEEQLAHQAFHDPVTGLANRVLFHDRVEHALGQQRRSRRSLAVLFVDLDDFKTVNDSLGHAAGDRLLAEVAVRLKTAVRAADTVARLGGDEFAILMEDASSEDSIEVAERILAAFRPPFILDKKEVFVRGSVGISVSGGDRTVAGATDAVLRDADVAMYAAKTLGKNRYQLFEPAMRETVVRRLELSADLQSGIENGEFAVFYQPVVELATSRVVGIEALVRWRHPRRGLLAPLEFIPFAEESGLIVPLGRWVLEEACRMAGALAEGWGRDRPLSLAVNLSARQLQDPEIVSDVQQALQHSGLDPARLTLEITETVMMREPGSSARTLARLKALGIRLAIDDFGTGYSSLTYIREFPFDILKIDKSFVDRMSSSWEDAAVTAAILELAAVLNLDTVAEGIEEELQLKQLMRLGCRFGQGFLFAPPLPAEELIAYLRRSSYGAALAGTAA